MSDLKNPAILPLKRSRLALKLGLFLVLALGAAGAAGYYAWTLRATHAELKDSIAGLERDSASLAAERAKNEGLNQEIATCRAEREASVKSAAVVQGDLSASKQELEALRAQRAHTEKQLAAFKEITESFKKMIDSGKLDVVVRKGRMVVKLPAGVLFDSGSADLSREGELALMEVAIVLRNLTDRQFMVAGHTDNRPLESASSSRFRNNWELSTARAVTVTGFLIEARMKPENLVAAGYGQHDPVGNNKTDRGRQENRRIEIVLLPTIEELPGLPGVEAEAGAKAPDTK